MVRTVRRRGRGFLRRRRRGVPLSPRSAPAADRGIGGATGGRLALGGGFGVEGAQRLVEKRQRPPPCLPAAVTRVQRVVANWQPCVGAGGSPVRSTALATWADYIASRSQSTYGRSL